MKERKSVATRLQEARQTHNFELITEISHFDEKCCVMNATIYKDHVPIGAGHAIEYRKNNVAYVECAETIAVGRALMLSGLVEDDGIASSDELAKAFAGDVAEDEEQPQRQVMTLDEALQTRVKSGKRYAEVSDENLRYILEHATNEKSIEAARIVLQHRKKL